MNPYDAVGAFGGLAALVVLGLSILVLVLWVIMPFYIISIRDEIRESNRLMRLIGKDLRKMQGEKTDQKEGEGV